MKQQLIHLVILLPKLDIKKSFKDKIKLTVILSFGKFTFCGTPNEPDDLETL